jgi:hypothetical protein
MDEEPCFKIRGFADVEVFINVAGYVTVSQDGFVVNFPHQVANAIANEIKRLAKEAKKLDGARGE